MPNLVYTPIHTRKYGRIVLLVVLDEFVHAYNDCLFVRCKVVSAEREASLVDQEGLLVFDRNRQPMLAISGEQIYALPGYNFAYHRPDADQPE